MSARKVAVIGASGLVGSSLVERMLVTRSHDVLPLIHTSGNAWRLARLGLELKPINLLDYAQLEAALAGCTHVVNCSRGTDEVMIIGLANMLKASRAAGVTGFVHLSSVAVYGDPPSPESVTEDAVYPRHDKQSYAGLKARQDEMVIKAARKGLPCVILCPPNISGPCSYFLLEVLQALRSRQFALLEDGSAPCVLVDVENLCHAIELALDDASMQVQRLFVTDDEDTTWRQVVEELLPLLDPGFSVESTSQLALSEARRAALNSSSFSIVRSLKHLVSSSVREALRNDPLWARVDRQLRMSVAYLGSGVEGKLRRAIEGNLPVPRPPNARTINANLCAQQLRGVRHSCAKAKKSIGYQPVVRFSDSMAAFRRWYQATHHTSSSYWDLLKRLYHVQER